MQSVLQYLYGGQMSNSPNVDIQVTTFAIIIFNKLLHVYIQCIYIFKIFQVERIRLSHDNSGPNPEWYLESLKIEIPSRGEKYMFPCNRWLTGDEDRRVEVEVYPGRVNIVAVKNKVCLIG